MTTGLHILTEGDDAEDLAGFSNVVPFVRPAREPVMIGEEFDLIVADLAVRMRGQFFLPRLLVLAT